jgi:oxalate decarboxylase/phosphoglucose isomerase-like protein (cupin superfamily)
VHPFQQERFVIRTGEITLRVAGAEKRHRTGDTVIIPAGTPHMWRNSGEEELRILVEFRPAGRIDDFASSFFALAHAGGTKCSWPAEKHSADCGDVPALQ